MRIRRVSGHRVFWADTVHSVLGQCLGSGFTELVSTSGKRDVTFNYPLAYPHFWDPLVGSRLLTFSEASQKVRCIRSISEGFGT
ncbi:hypothetical protein CDES_07400 [Corynebacterium deserti GIMN1.010]|uniref:Uncharacterized protein n=1 Tax=Corynebacterium deserti GIMN1.010 TaxID=931089 RepID=A0A0M4CDZ0_9CORY|nr:hypothetical protein CDES_07400 [Corynebacterium deserti GIMN1.010]